MHVRVKKSHFENMRCAYRPVTTKTTMGITKMGKGNNANGMICQIQRSFRERISRRSYEKEKNTHQTKRNAPKTPKILIMDYFNCIHRLCDAA